MFAGIAVCVALYVSAVVGSMVAASIPTIEDE